ncbi:MAG: ACT domain-containing protein [Candidatus Omnitrophica bacterium]|nr:ACT domain-containing protein [Candidatus Omnitrophota bacterium]
MKITQISVFLENKEGRLHDAVKTLSDKGINIRTLTIAESKDFGVLRIIVDRPEEAKEALVAHGFVARITEIVAVEVDDRPGGLARLLQVLQEHRINIEYMYAFTEKRADKGIMVFRFDDADAAIAALKSHSIGVVGQKDVVNL